MPEELFSVDGSFETTPAGGTCGDDDVVDLRPCAESEKGLRGEDVLREGDWDSPSVGRGKKRGDCWGGSLEEAPEVFGGADDGRKGAVSGLNPDLDVEVFFSPVVPALAGSSPPAEGPDGCASGVGDGFSKPEKELGVAEASTDGVCPTALVAVDCD